MNDAHPGHANGKVTAITLLRDLNQLDEHPRIEAKTGSELGKSALQTVCAFANEPRLGGGYLLFGVRATNGNSGGRYEAAGVSDPDKLQTDLASQCNSAFNRAIRPELWAEMVGDKVLVGAYVPESPAGHKPVYFTGTSPRRARVLATAFAANPEPFVRGFPAPTALPTAAWINRPSTQEVAR